MQRMILPKELLDQDSEDYDPNGAVELLIRAANMGCGVAKYRLGKMFLRGDEVPQNVDYALRWLEESVSEGNQYAEYLLGKTLLKGELVEQDTDRGEDLLPRETAMPVTHLEKRCWTAVCCPRI